jgi:hypothetical protein
LVLESVRHPALTSGRSGASLTWKNVRQGAEVMEPEKNLHARIAPALLAEAEKAAQAEHITLDELVSDAMERRLNSRV